MVQVLKSASWFNCSSSQAWSFSDWKESMRGGKKFKNKAKIWEDENSRTKKDERRFMWKKKGRWYENEEEKKRGEWIRGLLIQRVNKKELSESLFNTCITYHEWIFANFVKRNFNFIRFIVVFVPVVVHSAGQWDTVVLFLYPCFCHFGSSTMVQEFWENELNFRSSDCSKKNHRLGRFEKWKLIPVQVIVQQMFQESVGTIGPNVQNFAIHEILNKNFVSSWWFLDHGWKMW